MSDLKNWERNNGSDSNNGAEATRRGALALLSSLLKTPKAGAIGACAALLLAAGSGFAAENERSRSTNNLDSIPVASSSWTSPSGRAIVDLKAKSASKVGQRAQYPIRQTQALTPAPVSSPEFSEPLLDDELLAPPADPEPLVDPATLGDPSTLGAEPLVDPATLGGDLVDGGTLAEAPEDLATPSAAPAPTPTPAELSGTIEEIPASPTRLGAPSETLVDEAIPAPTKQEADLAPEPLAPVAPVAPSPEPRQAPSIVAGRSGAVALDSARRRSRAERRRGAGEPEPNRFAKRVLRRRFGTDAPVEQSLRAHRSSGISPEPILRLGRSDRRERGSADRRLRAKPLGRADAERRLPRLLGVLRVPAKRSARSGRARDAQPARL